MKENTNEKRLISVNENSIFYKIQHFFKNLFSRKDSIDISLEINNEVFSIKEKEYTESSFVESVKNIEDEETKLLRLQKQYRSGEIKEEDLTEEQVSSLCDLYDKQILKLRKSNEFRKQKILEYKIKLVV